MTKRHQNFMVAAAVSLIALLIALPYYMGSRSPDDVSQPNRPARGASPTPTVDPTDMDPEADSMSVGAPLRRMLERHYKADLSLERRDLRRLAREREDDLLQRFQSEFAEASALQVLRAIYLAATLDLSQPSLPIGAVARATSPLLRKAGSRALQAIESETGLDSHGLPEIEQELIHLSALDALLNRSTDLLVLMVNLFDHYDTRVRVAAGSVFPALDPGSKALARLLNMAESRNVRIARPAILALGYAGISREVEARLYEVIERKPDGLVVASLRSLSHKGLVLRRPEVLLNVVESEDSSRAEKAAALIALERTGTVPVVPLSTMAPKLPPPLRLLVARCLVTAGERSGIDLLIQLSDSSSATTALSATIVLTELAGRDYGYSRGTDGWEQWLEEFQEVSPQLLRTPAERLPRKSTRER